MNSVSLRDARGRWRGARWSWVGLLALGLGWSGQPAMAQTSAASKSVLNKATVNLPIQIDDRFRSQIQEVQLWVKDSPQAPWSMREKVAGTQTFFTFRAPQDGEYAFNVVTMDRNGRTTPADVTQEAPGLVVVIDTTAPQADVRSVNNSPEGMMVQCEVRDANPDPAKTRFFYETRNGDWRPVDPATGQTDTFCIPAQAATTGKVRLVATDMAGNTSSREISVSALASNGNFGNPQGNVSTVGYTPPAKNVGLVETPTEKVFVAPPPSDLVAPPLPPNTIIMEKNPAPPPAVNQKPAAQPVVLNDRVPLIERIETIANKSSFPAAVTSEVSSNPPPTSTLPVVQENKPADEKTPTPGIQTTKNLYASNAPAPGPELNVRRHLVNSTHVVLDYQIEQTGASGIGRVEIWYTRDKGQNWLKLGEDVDRKSPAELDLPGEGMFGVSLVVANGRGFGAVPPKAGDAPDWWIEVDLTKPQGDLLNVRSGNGEEGSLNITWFAKDKNLHSEPIDLFYAVKREGPWHVIAKNLKNDGTYCWTPAPDIGSHAFIRLVIRDQAGNSSSSETVQSIPLDDLSRPRGRVVSITTPMPRPTLAPNGIASQGVPTPPLLPPPLNPNGN